MKANINGIQVEGTPKEIVEFRELLLKSTTEIHVASTKDDKDFRKIIEEIEKKMNENILSKKPIIFGTSY